MVRLLRTSIVYRGASVVLGIAVAVGLLFAFLSYRITEENESELTRSRIMESLAMVENTASIACYLNDQNLASELARGLIRSADIREVNILNNERVLASAIKPDSNGTSTNTIMYDVFSPFNSKEKVCTIRLFPNVEFIRMQSQNKASFIVSLLLMQAMILAVAVIFMISRMITSPIKELSDKLHSLSPDSGAKLPVPQGNESDEIGQLVTDVNALVSNLLTILSVERSLRIQHAIGEKKFQTIFENAETGIFQIKDDGALISFNQSFLRMLSIPRKEANEKALMFMLEGQELRLHLMIEQAKKEGRAVSEDFCISIGNKNQKKWINLVLGATDDGLLQGLLNDITERKQSEENAQQLAVTDFLTGLNNRMGLERELSRLSQAASLGQYTDFFIFLIDLDKFKQVNDTYGHVAGDKVLIHFAQVLNTTLRKSDFTARLGGDEFVCILKDLNSIEKADEIAAKIVELAQIPVPVDDGVTVQIGASIGISRSTPENFDPNQLLEQADHHMYEVKHMRKKSQA